jgi:hypothetical protein
MSVADLKKSVEGAAALCLDPVRIAPLSGRGSKYSV